MSKQAAEWEGRHVLERMRLHQVRSSDIQLVSESIDSWIKKGTCDPSLGEFLKHEFMSIEATLSSVEASAERLINGRYITYNPYEGL